MKHYTLLIFIFIQLLIRNNAIAQNPECSVCGEYYLEGVMETASGFKLNADGTFEFFFSSGALDRYGSGHWNRTMSDHISFTTAKKPMPALRLIAADKSADQTIKISVQDGNEMINPYFFVFGFVEGDTVYAECDRKGMALLEKEKYDSLRVVFQFCPDHTLQFVPDYTKNLFTIKAEAWLFEYYFNDFQLRLTQEGLMGKHPMLQGEFTYSRNDK